MRLRSIDLEFLYHLEVKWKPGGQKNCETFALQFGSCERNNVCVCITNIPTIFIQGIYPRGFLILTPKGTCVRLFIMVVFTEEKTLR